MVWLGLAVAVQAQSFLISEFCAANDTGIRDKDGDRSDWIELYNPSVEAVSVGGWYLTDDVDALTRWRLPDVLVPGRGVLLVFASGKDRTDPGGELHTNFQLDRDGEYLALVGPDGTTVESHFGAAYPAQVSDVSYGLEMRAEPTIFVPVDAPLRWRLPLDGALGAGWPDVGFDDRGWRAGTQAIGYDVAGGSSDPLDEPTYPVDDITRPGDVIVATSPNSPPGEEVEKAIDDASQTKYLNFDGIDAGFTVTPAVGPSIVTHVRFTSANDAPGRDPTSFRLDGSQDGQQFEAIAEGPIPAFSGRFATVEVPVEDAVSCRHYRLLFPTIQEPGAATAMQIAEVAFGGLVVDASLPSSRVDVTQPGDSVEPTSFNSPGNEGASNVFDNDPTTKYLNFDKLDAGLTVTPGVGESVVSGLRFTSANDAPERDPTQFELWGSVDGVNYVLIDEGTIPLFTERFESVETGIANTSGYTSYRLLFTAVRDADAAVAVQIAELELLGTIGPPLPALGDLLGTDTEVDMYEKQAAAYVRIPFTGGPGVAVDALTLHARYDDGFIAYLNGTEVARANVPAAAGPDDTATVDRSSIDALTWRPFTLASYGDRVQPGPNVFAVLALNHAADSDEFLFQARLENVEVTVGTAGYVEFPTPGALNGDRVLAGVTEAPRLNPPHGFCDAPLLVTLTTATENAMIRFTTDGSVPSPDTGQAYTGPVTVDRTTVLRAGAFRDGWLPARTATATYLFPDDIVTQDRAAVLAAGLPPTWNTQPADYGLDPRVTGPDGTDQFGGKYTAELREALLAVPTLSIVMDVEDLFGRQGLYANPEFRGAQWERAASIELLDPDGAPGFQQDAGIRIQGGAFRRFDLTLKKSFRIVFRGRYGATELAYPLFGPEATDHFDNVVLRANANDAWKWGGSDSLYVRDAFAQETLRAMGQVAPHSTFVHLYLNGLYWGLYNPVERPDASFGAAYFGGDKDAWDALNQDSVPDGTAEAWNRLLAWLGQEVADNAVYQGIQGNHPDGSPDPAGEDLLEVDNLIDYMLMNFYIGNTDWPHRNYWIARDQVGTGGFRFFPWDSETALDLAGSSLTTDRTGVSTAVARPYHALRANADFCMRFADRAYHHFAPGGALYVNSAAPGWDPARPEDNRPAARLAALTARIDRAIVAESARWGDQRNDFPFTRDEHWRPQRDALLAAYFPTRSARVLQQLRGAGLYPALEPPVFNLPGGAVDPGFAVILTAAAGDIHYTTDGTDPRTPGAESDVAVYQDPIVVNDLTTILARVRDDQTWSALNVATFVVGTPRLAVSELNYHPHDPTPAERAAGFSDDDFEFIEFMNIGTGALDLSGMHFVDGVEFDFSGSAVTRLSAGAFVLVVRNQAAFAARYGGGFPVAGEYEGGFANSGERIALADADETVILAFTYGTAAPWPPAADGDGATLERRDLALAPAPAAEWRAGGILGGTPGTLPPASPVQISGLLRQGANLRLSFAPQTGHSYAAFFCSTLGLDAWTTHVPIRRSLDGEPTEVDVPIVLDEPVRLFRIGDSREAAP